MSADWRVPESEVPEYTIVIDGEVTTQNKMFTRGDMAYFGFAAGDVTPPRGTVLAFGESGEPMFVNPFTSEEVYHGDLRRFV